MVNVVPVSGDGIDTPYAGAFVGKIHRFALRVYFEDTDVAGIVYYANYLRFMERARSDMLRAVGIDQRAALDSGEGVYAVADLSIRYRAPAKLDDALVVVSAVREVRAASCLIHQRVMRGDQILTDATVTAAFLSPEGRPKRQPRAWAEIFERLKGDGN
jgi:acyl-CoA thioester hydrolase